MNRNDFLSAASKGLGRAIASVKSGQSAPSLGDMRRLILRWPGYDSQCENSRGWYSVEIMKASCHEAELRHELIAFLRRKPSESPHSWHRKSIALELAKRGDAAMRDTIYELFSAEDDFRFGDEIVALDGIEGLDWIVSHSIGNLDQSNAWRFEMWLEGLSEVQVRLWIEGEVDT